MVMTTEEIGAYLLLLCACWKEDGLDVNTKKLPRIARLREKKFLTLWENSLSACFYLDAETGKYRQKRLDKELKKQQLTSTERRHAAQKRWNGADANALQMQCKSNALHISSSSSTSNKTLPNGKGDKAAADTASRANTAQQKDPVERRIWTDGIHLISNNGVTEAQARTLLGRLARDYGKRMLAESIAATQAENPADPKAFLIAALRHRTRREMTGKATEPAPVSDCNTCFDTKFVRRWPDENKPLEFVDEPCPDCSKTKKSK